MALLVQTDALSEPNIVPDLSCNGLGRIEFIGGGQAAFVLYRNIIVPNAKDYERLACGRIYAPIAAMPEAIDLLVKAVIESGLVQAATMARKLLLC